MPLYARKPQVVHAERWTDRHDPPARVVVNPSAVSCGTTSAQMRITQSGGQALGAVWGRNGHWIMVRVGDWVVCEQQASGVFEYWVETHETFTERFELAVASVPAQKSEPEFSGILPGLKLGRPDGDIADAQKLAFANGVQPGINLTKLDPRGGT